MALTLTSPYFEVVELEQADFPIYVGAVQAVKTQLLDAVLKKYRVPRLVIEPLKPYEFAKFRYSERTIYLSNRRYLPATPEQRTDAVAFRAKSEGEYPQGFLIHECGHWISQVAPQSRGIIEACKNRPGCAFISKYASFDGFGEYFSENLVAFEWFGEELSTFDSEAYAMVKEVLEILL